MARILLAIMLFFTSISSLFAQDRYGQADYFEPDGNLLVRIEITDFNRFGPDNLTGIMSYEGFSQSIEVIFRIASSVLNELWRNGDGNRIDLGIGNYSLSCRSERFPDNGMMALQINCGYMDGNARFQIKITDHMFDPNESWQKTVTAGGISAACTMETTSTIPQCFQNGGNRLIFNAELVNGRFQCNATCRR